MKEVRLQRDGRRRQETIFIESMALFYNNFQLDLIFNFCNPIVRRDGGVGEGGHPWTHLILVTIFANIFYSHLNTFFEKTISDSGVFKLLRRKI